MVWRLGFSCNMMYLLWKTVIECDLFCNLFYVLAMENSNWMWFVLLFVWCTCYEKQQLNVFLFCCLFDVHSMKNSNWMRFVLWFVLCTHYEKQQLNVICFVVCFIVQTMKTAIECDLFCGLFYVQAMENNNWMWFVLLFVLCTSYENSNWMWFVL